MMKKVIFFPGENVYIHLGEVEIDNIPLPALCVHYVTCT